MVKVSNEEIIEALLHIMDMLILHDAVMRGVDPKELPKIAVTKKHEGDDFMFRFITIRNAITERHNEMIDEATTKPQEGEVGGALCIKCKVTPCECGEGKGEFYKPGTLPGHEQKDDVGKNNPGPG